MADKKQAERDEAQFRFLATTPGAMVAAREAEVLLTANPRLSILSCRQANQTLINRLHGKYLGRAPLETINAIEALAKAGRLPAEVVEASHRIRVEGNRSAHSMKGRSETDALAVLGDLFEVAKACSAVFDGRKFRRRRFDPDTALRIGRANDHEAHLARALDALEAERERTAALVMATPAVTAALERPDVTEDELLSIGQEQLGADDDEFAQHPLRDHLIAARLAEAAWADGTRDPGPASFPDRDGALHTIDHAAWSDSAWPLAILETTHSRRSLQAGMAYAEAVADLIEAEHGHRPVVLASNGIEHLRRSPDGEPEGVSDFDSFSSLTAAARS